MIGESVFIYNVVTSSINKTIEISNSVLGWVACHMLDLTAHPDSFALVNASLDWGSNQREMLLSETELHL